ncbi:hypothetical protein OC844_005648 [Tilletia horrida]|nr:hypothetical protein OC844_005648 [Tilletia horrida]
MKAFSLGGIAGATLLVLAASLIPASVSAHSDPLAPRSLLQLDVDPLTGTLEQRDAYNLEIAGRHQDGGPRYGPLPVPAGSRLRNFTVGNNGEQTITYWSDNGIMDASVESAIIVIHGRNRDGATYWSIADQALRSAIRDGYAGANPKTVVVAPQFLSSIRNQGQYTANQIAFADANAWQVGEEATAPQGTSVTSFSAINGLLGRLALTSQFPKLKRVVLVGHGGGGQMISRYAVLGEVPSSAQYSIRFVIGNPSSNLYFTPNRPLTSSFDARGASRDRCPLYNTYRYGFDRIKDFCPTAAASSRTPQSYFSRFVQRDVVFLVSNADTDASGDQTCMAILLGGVARRDRTFSYWRYINQLAGTGADLSAFKRGRFSSQLPNWSSLTGGKLRAQLSIVPDAGHNPVEVFGHSLGRAALFDQGKVPVGASPA